jgi:hypothetical protein
MISRHGFVLGDCSVEALSRFFHPLAGYELFSLLLVNLAVRIGIFRKDSLYLLYEVGTGRMSVKGEVPTSNRGMKVVRVRRDEIPERVEVRGKRILSENIRESDRLLFGFGFFFCD